MTWRHRLRDLDQRATQRMGEDDRRLTGDGWRVLALAALVFGLGWVLFGATGDWWPSIPAALGAIFLGIEARRMHHRWRSNH